MHAHCAYNTFLGFTCIGLLKQFEHPTDIPGTCRHAHESSLRNHCMLVTTVLIQFVCTVQETAKTGHLQGRLQQQQHKLDRPSLKLLSAIALLAANTGSHAPLATCTRSHALLPANTDHTPSDMRQLVSHPQVLQCTAAQHCIKNAKVHFMLSC